ERCTVVYRPARLRLESWTVRWLSDTPSLPGSRTWGNPVPRIATLCRFRDLATGTRLGVADTHWDGASAASRLRSAEALLGWLDPALPWVVLGDLNAVAGDPAVVRLLAGGLRDTLAHLGERGPRAATHHHWDGATAGTRIDYVLVTAPWEVLGARIAHPRPGGRLPSDHWPVVADLRLPG
ncbi:MAG: endonuclease/exonuclease/phosphatase family protein, partial [Thermoleophilia bacterium]